MEMKHSSFVIESRDLEEMQAKSGQSMDTLLSNLVWPTRALARPPISGFFVGAVALGASGRVFRGVNLEFPGLPLNNSVHAEQFLVINAAQHGERELRVLAVSAAPCGHCRQFLQELRGAPELRILIVDDPDPACLNNPQPQSLAYFLPHRFGPGDVLEGDFPLLLEPRANGLRIACHDDGGGDGDGDSDAQDDTHENGKFVSLDKAECEDPRADASGDLHVDDDTHEKGHLMSVNRPIESEEDPRDSTLDVEASNGSHVGDDGTHEKARLVNVKESKASLLDHTSNGCHADYTHHKLKLGRENKCSEGTSLDVANGSLADDDEGGKLRTESELQTDASNEFQTHYNFHDKEQITRVNEAKLKDLRNAALDAANGSHAPYTNSPAGVALLTKNGKIYSGSYVESVAYNPGLPPLQSALVAFVARDGGSYEDLEHAILVEKKEAPVQFAEMVELLLKKISPKCKLHVYHATVSRT